MKGIRYENDGQRSKHNFSTQIQNSKASEEMEEQEFHFKSFGCNRYVLKGSIICHVITDINLRNNE